MRAPSRPETKRTGVGRKRAGWSGQRRRRGRDACPAVAATSDAPGRRLGAEEEKPDEDELIEVWRPAPRRPRHADRGRARSARGLETAACAGPEGAARPQATPPRKPWRDRRQGSGASTASGAARGGAQAVDRNPSGAWKSLRAKRGARGVAPPGGAIRPRVRASTTVEPPRNRRAPARRARARRRPNNASRA